MPLKDEEPEDINKVTPIIKKLREPYKDRERTRWTGPSRIGTSLYLREDFYAVTFLYELKRKTLYKDDLLEDDNSAFADKSNFYKDYPAHRKNMMGKWRFMVITQLLLIWFLGIEAITHSDNIEAFMTPPAGG